MLVQNQLADLGVIEIVFAISCKWVGRIVGKGTLLVSWFT
jgi:hypothetical protein